MSVSEADILAMARIPEPVLFEVLSLPDPSVAEVEQRLPEHLKHFAEILHYRLTTAPVAEPEAQPVQEPPHQEQPQEPPQQEPPHQEQPQEPPQTEAVQQEPPQREAVQDPNRPLTLQEQLAQRGKRGETYRSVMRPEDELPVPASLFVDFDHSTAPNGELRHQSLVVRERAIEDKKIVQVTWSPLANPDGKQVMYRVIAGDRELALSPEAGELVWTTTGLGYEEPVPSGIAFRHYQVWANMGADLDECLASQPVFIGQEIFILPVADATIAESQGVVEGRWTVPPGCSEVRVFASDMSELGAPDDRQFQLVEGVQERYFDHRPKQRGVTMRYALQPVVQFQGHQRVGRSTVFEQAISATLEKVEFESCERITVDGKDRILLDWFAPPAGAVHIYLSENSPSSEMSYLSEVPVEALRRDPALAEGQLHAEDPQPHGTQMRKSIFWPNEWTEVHITPVTVIEGKAAVSATQVLQRVAPIERPELKERSESQLVIFEWPKGADFVRVETASLGETDPSRRVLVQEVDEARYRETGGVRLKLQQNGQMVILTPLSRHSGALTVAKESIVNYPGLRRFHYRILPEPRGLFISIWCDGFEVPNPPRFQLVQNPKRYPLSSQDILDPGAGPLSAAGMDAAGNLEVPGIIIAPYSLPNNEADAAKRPWFVSAEQLVALQDWPYLRLFLLDDDSDVETAPRKILTDEYANVPRIDPSAWRQQ